MSFRGATIYVQGQTRHRLTLLARVMPAHPVLAGYESNQAKTADELGDELLNEIMLTKFPQLKELEAQIRVLEEAATEAIRNQNLGKKEAHSESRPTRQN